MRVVFVYVRVLERVCERVWLFVFSLRRGVKRKRNKMKKLKLRGNQEEEASGPRASVF